MSMDLVEKGLHILIFVCFLKFNSVLAAANGNVNQDFDKSLSFMRTVIKGQEPFVTGAKGNIIYCNFTGAYTIFRNGDITALKVNDSVSQIYLNIGWKRIVISCLVKNTFLFIKISTGVAVGVIDDLTIYTEALVNYDNDNLTRVQSVDVVNRGKLVVSYSSEGFLGKAIEYFVKFWKSIITFAVHSVIIEAIEILIKQTRHHLGFIGGHVD